MGVSVYLCASARSFSCPTQHMRPRLLNGNYGAEKKKKRWGGVGEKDGVGREWVGSEGGRWRWEGKKEMHKQMLALGIDAISSVSQLMTNSTEERGAERE